MRAFEGAPDVVRSAFMRPGTFAVTLDDPFSAAAAHTVSATAARMGAMAMQLEINSALLMEDSPSERFGDVLGSPGRGRGRLRAMLCACQK